MFVFPQILIPSETRDPFTGLPEAGPVRDHRLDLQFRGDAVKIEARQRLSQPQHVAVRIDETGNDGFAVDIDPPGFSSHVVADAVSDGEKPPGLDRDGRGGGLPRVHGVNASVHNHQIRSFTEEIRGRERQTQSDANSESKHFHSVQ